MSTKEGKAVDAAASKEKTPAALSKTAILFPKAMAPLTLTNYVKLTTNLSGRDKVMRMVQYAIKAIVFNIGEKAEYAKQLLAFQKAVGKNIFIYFFLARKHAWLYYYYCIVNVKREGLHRKAFKLGVFLDEGLKFLEALSDEKMKDLERFLTLVQRLSMVMFAIYDNIIWLLEVKATEAFDKNNAKMKSYQFRFVAAVCAIIQSMMSLR